MPHQMRCNWHCLTIFAQLDFTHRFITWHVRLFILPNKYRVLCESGWFNTQNEIFLMGVRWHCVKHGHVKYVDPISLQISGCEGVGLVSKLRLGQWRAMKASKGVNMQVETIEHNMWPLNHVMLQVGHVPSCPCAHVHMPHHFNTVPCLFGMAGQWKLPTLLHLLCVRVIRGASLNI